jgi:rare lipoprotein A
MYFLNRTFFNYQIITLSCGMRFHVTIVLIVLTATSCAGQEQKDSLQRNGKASFYHDSFEGQETSNGEIYEQNDFTAAHRTLPFNTFVHVTNKQNNKSVVVRINDRGPFKKSRIIDLTRSAAQKIGMIPYGVVPVKIQTLDLLDYLPLNDSMLKEGEVWDCYGNQKSLNGITLYIWKTEFWKHAFYMASDMLVDYHLDSIVVKTTGDLKHRLYYVLLSGINNKDEANTMILKLKQEGFRGVRTLK